MWSLQTSNVQTSDRRLLQDHPELNMILLCCNPSRQMLHKQFVIYRCLSSIQLMKDSMVLVAWRVTNVNAVWTPAVSNALAFGTTSYCCNIDSFFSWHSLHNIYVQRDKEQCALSYVPIQNSLDLFLVKKIVFLWIPAKTRSVIFVENHLTTKALIKLERTY